MQPLRDAIAQFYQDEYGVQIGSNRVFVTPGASGALLLALGIGLNPHEQVLMADPCYPCNKNFVYLFDGQPQTIAVDATTAYQLNNADLIRRFVINSFSKFFGMTGWCVGWLIVPEGWIEATEKLAQNLFIAAPTPSQYAALAAFSAENCAKSQRRREEFKQRRDFLYQGLLQLGFEIACKLQGAFYIYADCSRFSDNSFQWVTDLLETEGVAVTPGRDFGNYRANHYIRFAYTQPIARMAHALHRMERFICR